jgi:hypothetical protein
MLYALLVPLCTGMMTVRHVYVEGSQKYFIHIDQLPVQ